MLFQLTDPLGDISARADISSTNPRQFGSAEESQALNLCFPWLLNIDQSRTDLAPGSCQTRLVSEPSVSISLGLLQGGCNFAPLRHWERLRVPWQHLNADVVGARGLMGPNSIRNSRQITPGDDGVH